MSLWQVKNRKNTKKSLHVYLPLWLKSRSDRLVADLGCHVQFLSFSAMVEDPTCSDKIWVREPFIQNAIQFWPSEYSAMPSKILQADAFPVIPCSSGQLYLGEKSIYFNKCLCEISSTVPSCTYQDSKCKCENFGHCNDLRAAMGSEAT